MLRRSKKKQNKSVLEAPKAAPDFSETLGGYELPSFPALVAQALSQLSDPSADMAEVASVVERDPGTTAKVLQIVNSASFSPRNKVTSVHQGAMLLGRNQLESVLISVGAHGVLPKPDCAGFVQERFWASAARRAVLARMIAQHVDPTRSSENFTAALLQDMALPVLALRADFYGDVLDHWHNSTDDLADLEQENFGWNHGMVAGWMGEQWEFPADFVHFMDGHHGETDVYHLLPARVVSPIRETDDEGEARVIEEGSARLNIRPDELAKMIEDSVEEASALAQLLS